MRLVCIRIPGESHRKPIQVFPVVIMWLFSSANGLLVFWWQSCQVRWCPLKAWRGQNVGLRAWWVENGAGTTCRSDRCLVCCWSSNVKMPANGSNVTVKNGGDIIVKGPITWDDATWILTSAFIIFTMQSGRYTTASLSGDVTIKCLRHPAGRYLASSKRLHGLTFETRKLFSN